MLTDMAMTVDDPHGMVRLFEDCIDFHDSETLSSSVLYKLANLDDFNHFYLGRRIEPCTRWLLRKFGSEIAEALDLDKEVESACGRAMELAIARKDLISLRMFLDLHNKVVDIHTPYDDHSMLHVIVATAFESPGQAQWIDGFRLLLERGADLHKVCRGNTPTLLAMRSAHSFQQWLVLLLHSEQSVKSFIADELASKEHPLHKLGWRQDTLHDLFILASGLRLYKPYRGKTDSRRVLCSGCSKQLGMARNPYALTQLWWKEPWWEKLLYRLRTKECVCWVLESDNDRPSLECKEVSDTEQLSKDRDGRKSRDSEENYSHMRQEVNDSYSAANSDERNTQSKTGPEVSHVCRWRLETGGKRFTLGPRAEEANPEDIYSEVLDFHNKAPKKDDAVNEEHFRQSQQEKDQREMWEEAVWKANCEGNSCEEEWRKSDESNSPAMFPFYAQEEMWPRKYLPGELFCHPCLLQLEICCSDCFTKFKDWRSGLRASGSLGGVSSHIKFREWCSECRAYFKGHKIRMEDDTSEEDISVTVSMPGAFVS